MRLGNRAAGGAEGATAPETLRQANRARRLNTLESAFSPQGKATEGVSSQVFRQRGQAARMRDHPRVFPQLSDIFE